MSQMGRFDRVFTGVPPCAYETAFAIDVAADKPVEQRVDQRQ